MKPRRYFAWDVEDYRSETGNLMIRRECLQAALADHFRERAARALKNPAVSLDNDRVWSWAGRAAADIDGYPDIADIDLEIDSIIENDFQMMIERREW